MNSALSISIKDAAVRIDNLTPAMARAVLRIFGVLRRRGIPFVITSGNDGEHKAHSARHPHSRHYDDEAIDFRLPGRWTGSFWREHSNEVVDRIVRDEIAQDLGPAYDVVLEGTHIHCEHDPKTTVA